MEKPSMLRGLRYRTHCECFNISLEVGHLMSFLSQVSRLLPTTHPLTEILSSWEDLPPLWIVSLVIYICHLINPLSPWQGL